MDTPGKVLKEERIRQKRSLREIARALKINMEYLKAIEEDNYSRLPADIFARSYLKMYAQHLGIDEKQIIKMYNLFTGSEAKEVKEEPPSSSDIQTGKKIKSIVIHISKNLKPKYFLILIAIVLILAIGIVLIRGNTKEEKDILPVQKIQTEEIPIEEKEGKELVLEIKAEELTWVSVRIDGGDPQEYLLREGQSIKLRALEKFQIKVGNAGSTRLFLNNKDIGPLGPKGKVVDIQLP
jgi:cytoskeletal protein RodZ